MTYTVEVMMKEENAPGYIICYKIPLNERITTREDAITFTKKIKRSLKENYDVRILETDIVSMFGIY